MKHINVIIILCILLAAPLLTASHHTDASGRQLFSNRWDSRSAMADGPVLTDNNKETINHLNVSFKTPKRVNYRGEPAPAGKTGRPPRPFTGNEAVCKKFMTRSITGTLLELFYRFPCSAGNYRDYERILLLDHMAGPAAMNRDPTAMPDRLSGGRETETGQRRVFAVAGEDFNAYQGGTVILDGSGSYSANLENKAKIITFRWYLQSQPLNSNAAINNAESERCSIILEEHGVYIIGLTVTDETGEKGTDTVIITAAKTEFHPMPVIEAEGAGSHCTGGPIQLSASISSVYTGDIDYYAWEITGPGQAGMDYWVSGSRGKTITLIPYTPGNYHCLLRVGANGLEESTALDLPVRSLEIAAGFECRFETVSSAYIEKQMARVAVDLWINECRGENPSDLLFKVFLDGVHQDSYFIDDFVGGDPAGFYQKDFYLELEKRPAAFLFQVFHRGELFTQYEVGL